MRCSLYWREGIVLVERGLDDPHRASCADCTRAHASRQELIEALPLIGASYTGDPHWQAKVWRRIDGGDAHRAWRWRWPLAGALTVACVMALWIGLGRTRPDDVRPRREIVAGAEAKRSEPELEFADRNDHLRVTVGESSEVWIYRGEDLMLRCRAREVSDRCAPDSHGMIVEMVLSSSGEYQVIVVDAPVAMPRGLLDKDLAALESARTKYVKWALTVH